jgi:hypothetical protein
VSPRLALVCLALISVVAAGCGSTGPAPGRPDATDAPSQQEDGPDDQADATDTPGDVTDAPDAVETGPEGPVDPCSLCSPFAICTVPKAGDGGADASSSDGAGDAAASDGGVGDADAPEGGATDAPASDDGGADAAASEGGASEGGVIEGGASDAVSSDDAGSDAASPDAGEPPACMCRTGYAGNGMTCVEVATALNGLRWNLPCMVKDATDGCSTAADMTTTTLHGEAGKTYAVTLRFRGVVEQKTYAGGTGDGYWLAGATAPVDGYNVYELKVSSPAQVYYLNAGASGMRRVFVIDYTRTIDVDANAMVTLTADPVDGAEIRNTDGMGHSLAVPGIRPYPGAYDGQFIQVDVLSVVAK